MENQRQGKNNKDDKDDKNFAGSYQSKSITEWWQQYSPLAWVELYDDISDILHR
jgi:hypothetical protein